MTFDDAALSWAPFSGQRATAACAQRILFSNIIDLCPHQTDTSSSCIHIRTMMTMITVRADSDGVCDAVVCVRAFHHGLSYKPDFLLFLPWAMHVSALCLVPSLLSSTLSVDSQSSMLHSRPTTPIQFCVCRSLFPSAVCRCCCWCCRYLAFGGRFPVLP